MNMKMINKKYLIIGLALFVLAIFIAPVLASSDYGLSDTIDEGNLKDAFQVEEIENSGGAESFIATKTGRVIGQILSFLGVIFLILMIVGGISWMTAGGNQEKVSKAKKIITSAIIGLVIVFSAYAVTAFIGTMLTS